MHHFSFDDLDLGSRRRWPRLASVAFLAASTLAAAYTVAPAVSAYAALQSEKSTNEALVSRIRHARTAGFVSSTPSPAELQRLHEAALVSSRLRTPWPELLKLLEAASAQDIALLSVEPVAVRRQLRLSAEAKNVGAMLDYLAFLQAQVQLQHVTLLSHQMQHQVPGSPVRFQVQAQWGEQ